MGDFEEQSSVDRLFEDKEDDSAFPDSRSDDSESEVEDRDMSEANNRIKQLIVETHRSMGNPVSKTGGLQPSSRSMLDMKSAALIQAPPQASHINDRAPRPQFS